MADPAALTHRVATPADADAIVDFARRFFFVDEPLTIAIRLMEGGGRCTELEDYCTESLAEGNSLVSENADGEVVGIVLNGIKRRIEGPCEPEELPPPEGQANTKFRHIVRLLDEADAQADVFGRFPDVDAYVDIKILSVHPDYRGKGIAKQLIDQSRELTRAQGMSMVRCVCTSFYTHKAVARLGFQHVHTMPYKSFVDEQGRVVFDTEPPHDNVETYVARV
ncbi:dopamine N-acetyltransferase [Thrips palmi]|uniref:aralkylamine N-acetyltransferase n=1 Tax=Thrips palmi TaxID=161013 RepID=A0A6P8YQL7_THRPL|nr:dopamine N-acetyltransferase [Thrips palmi]